MEINYCLKKGKGKGNLYLPSFVVTLFCRRALMSSRSYVAALLCRRALMSPRSYVAALLCRTLLCRTLLCRALFLRRAFVAIPYSMLPAHSLVKVIFVSTRPGILRSWRILNHAKLSITTGGMKKKITV
jgi:hypothetical protein